MENIIIFKPKKEVTLLFFFQLFFTKEGRKKYLKHFGNRIFKKSTFPKGAFFTPLQNKSPLRKYTAYTISNFTPSKK